MAQSSENQIRIVERGNVYFMYRPRVEAKAPRGRAEVQRLHVVLSVSGDDRYRLITLGRKKMPHPRESGDKKFWGFVDQVTGDPVELRSMLQEETYETKTRGVRTRPAARPAGEGVYAIVRHGDHTHLVYELELPQEPEEVQREFSNEEEGSYIISVKNQATSSPPRAGLAARQKAEYPQWLQQQFRDRKFSEVDPSDFLNYPGTEMLIVAAGEDVSKELGIELNAQEETEATAEIFSDLRLEKTKHPVEPLITGKWK